MWIKGYEGFHFSAFIGGGEHRLFSFDAMSGTHEEVFAPDGQDFTPYGEAFTAFGKVLITGRATDASNHSAVGYELWEITENGTLELFSDIRIGEGSSFLRASQHFKVLGHPDFFVATARYDSDTYEMVAVFDDGSARTLGDMIDGIDNLRSLSAPVIYEGETVFLGSVGHGSRVPWVIDDASNQIKTLTDFATSVSGFSFDHLYVLDGQLFAKINTSEHGRELWVLDAFDRWKLVDDVSSGSRHSSPSWEFELDGVHYFTAVNDAYGRELYRLDGTNNLVRVTDLAPGAGNSFYGVRDFTYDGHVYFHAINSLSGLQFYRMGPGSVVERVDEFIDGQPGSYPSVLVDLDNGKVVTAPSEHLDGGQAYWLIDGQLSEFELPEGDLADIELRGGNLIAVTNDANGGFSVWIMAPNSDWHLVRKIDDAEGTQRVVDLSLVDEIGPGRDAYFGDEADEEVTSPTDGSIVFGAGGNDTIHGGNGKDELFGEEGNDSLFGGAGEDLLSGGSGRNLLTGGAGSDTFLFRDLEGQTTITDFESGTDVISLGDILDQAATYQIHLGDMCQTKLAFGEEYVYDTLRIHVVQNGGNVELRVTGPQAQPGQPGAQQEAPLVILEGVDLAGLSWDDFVI
ncbi:hypothetical protein [Aliiroseovarius sp.]|uniref:hypothetical protein n=1 Tax=Aliiroseovarius sp. TaxID=1872442 RepID=UPI003BA8D086